MVYSALHISMCVLFLTVMIVDPYLFVVFAQFRSSKKSGKGKRPRKGGNRFWKSVGLGFKTPKEAIEGSFLSVFIYLSVCIYMECLRECVDVWF